MYNNTSIRGDGPQGEKEMEALRYGVYKAYSWVEVDESGKEIPCNFPPTLVYSADILEAAEEHAAYERRAFRTATITVVDHLTQAA